MEDEIKGNIKMDLKMGGVVGRQWRSCSVVGFGIGDTEPLGSATTVFVIGSTGSRR